MGKVKLTETDSKEMIERCIRGICMTTIALVLVGTIAIFYLYEVKQEGELTLSNAWGTATITREVETEIPHIRGDDFNSIIYAQGFAHAQTRLWQMERMRRVASG